MTTRLLNLSMIALVLMLSACVTINVYFPEAAGQGFDQALVPEGNLKGVKARITARGCKSLAQALALI